MAGRRQAANRLTAEKLGNAQNNIIHKQSGKADRHQPDGPASRSTEVQEQVLQQNKAHNRRRKLDDRRAQPETQAGVNVAPESAKPSSAAMRIPAVKLKRRHSDSPSLSCCSNARMAANQPASRSAEKVDGNHLVHTPIAKGPRQMPRIR